ncbi:MAG: potassium transporter TrkA [Acidimicrobiales bacterium]|nr:MAG: potassium transporter TrkA [Acidimicrobiales bacterium]
MPEIHQTRLPGVGLRHEFCCRSGPTLAVISHRTGTKELVVYSEEDPDTVAWTILLEPEEATALAEILGGSRVIDHLEELEERIAGLVVDWFPIEASSTLAHHSIAEREIRRKTGVSIVAVVREGRAIPAPSPEFVLEPGDTAVLVGTPEGLEAFVELAGVKISDR